MPHIPKQTFKATPKLEDFGHKYTEEGQGTIGRKLLDGYFSSVEKLFIQSNISERKNAKAIEIGCGEGFSTQRLRELLPKKVSLTASEFVPALVPIAQALNPSVTVIEESIYETTHADNTYDVIFLLEVLEHLDYPDAALQELARILKPDGYLILGVPREPIWCSLNMARGKYLRHFGNTPGHLNHWTSTSLKGTVRNHFGPVLKMRQPLPWTQVLAQKHA